MSAADLLAPPPVVLRPAADRRRLAAEHEALENYTQHKMVWANLG